MRFTSCFIGVPLPEKYQQNFEEVLIQLGALLPDARLARKQTPHITLYYLDEQSQDQIKSIVQVIEVQKSLVRQSPVTVRGLGTFGLDSPRVLYASVQHDESLPAIHQQFCKALNEFYAADNNLGFHAHVTLARLTNEKAQEQFKSQTAEIKKLLDAISWEFAVNELVLYGVDSTQEIEYQQKLAVITV